MEDNKKHICKYCNKEFKSGQSLGAHIIHCKENPNSHKDKWINKKKEKYENENPLQEYILKCIICGKEYKLQLRKKQYEQGKYRKTCCCECSHKLSSLNTNLEEKNKKISNSLKGNTPYIKGKTYKNGIWINNINYKEILICPICGKEYKNNGLRYCSVECKKIGLKNNLSKSLKGKTGGLRPNAYKKYKSGLYHNIHCDSSWELAFVIYCEEHNILLERNHNFLTYTFENKEYKYYPDFIINGTFYEIKGYENAKAKAKHEQHPEVIYLDKYKMKKYLDYVISKYGKDYIKLYDRLDKQVE